MSLNDDCHSSMALKLFFFRTIAKVVDRLLWHYLQSLHVFIGGEREEKKGRTKEIMKLFDMKIEEQKNTHVISKQTKIDS
jgi:hypothetical protein